MMMEDRHPERPDWRERTCVPFELLGGILKLCRANNPLALEERARRVSLDFEVRMLLQKRTVEADDVEGQCPAYQEPPAGTEEAVGGETEHRFVEGSEGGFRFLGRVDHRHVFLGRLVGERDVVIAWTERDLSRVEPVAAH